MSKSKTASAKSPPEFKKPPLVITLHGIRTHGRWQKQAADLLSQKGIGVSSFDYGRFGVFSLLLRRLSLVDRFYRFFFDEINKSKDVDLADPRKRPSIIAHSLGTYIIGNCLLKHTDVKIDKLILVGSILPRDFDWQQLIARSQIGRIWNQVGAADWVPGLAARALADAGDSGKCGFNFYSDLFHQDPGDYFKHSDALIGHHISNRWLPFLNREPYSCTVIDGSQVESAEQAQRIFEQTGGLDDEVYGGTPHYPEARIPDGLAEEWIQVNPDIYSFLISSADTVEGYLNAMPMEDEYFEKLLSADPIMDTEITGEWLVPYGINSELNIYIMSVVTSPRSSSPALGLYHQGVERLIVAFVDKLIRLFHDRKISIKRILAVGWTVKGERLCKLLGMKRLRKDKFDHWVYFLDLNEARLGSKGKTHHALSRLIKAYTA